MAFNTLPAAAKAGHAKCVEVLHDNCKHFSEALIAAASEGHTECLQLLLNARAYVEQYAYAMALIEASKGGHAGCVSLLVRTKVVRTKVCQTDAIGGSYRHQSRFCTWIF